MNEKSSAVMRCKVFVDEWKEFCDQHKLSSMLRNTVVRTAYRTLDDRAKIVARYESFGHNPSNWLQSIYQEQARRDLLIFDSFQPQDGQPFDTLEQWLSRVHSGNFPIRAMRQMGRVSERQLLEAIRKHFERRSNEYGYA